MAKEQKTILEEALLDVERIQKALNANTKEILRSVAKEEIDGVLKESLNEDDFEEEDVETSTDKKDTDDETETDKPDSGETEDGETGEETDLVPVPTGDDEAGDETSDSEIGNSEMGDETGMDAMASDLGDELDMTGSSDEDVISVYKKLTGDDQIEVVGDDVHLTVSEPGEYVIKGAAKSETELAPEIGSDETSELGSDEPSAMGSEDEDEITYEIAMDEYGDEHEMSTADALKTGEMEEGMDENSVRALNNGRNQSLKPQNFPDDKKGGRVNEAKSNDSKLMTETVAKYNKLLTEAKQLKTENGQFRDSLKTFRNMLVETVVFNSNLTYVTKLFMEHSTTKDEKKSILKRFDEEVSNLKESKKLYKTIANELSGRKPITETIDSKINKDNLTTSTSKQLNESTAYVDKDTKKIIDLINRVENKNN